MTIICNFISLEQLKTLFEIGAFICAAWFFIYKFNSGYHNVNLSLELKGERKEYDSEKDILILNLELKKGESGSLTIYDISAKINEEKEIYTFIGIKRQSFKGQKINWEKISTSVPNINLSASETTSFSTFAIVPKNKTCTVQVCVLGKKFNHCCKKSQWKTSKIF